MYRLISISKKELLQIVRDRRTLLIILVLPVSLLILFGYAISLDVTNIRIGIYDKDKTEASRNFIRAFESTHYFRIVAYINSDKEVNESIDKGVIQCAVVIPQHFARDIESKKNVIVQFLIDGVDANTATIILNYVNATTSAYSQKISSEFLSAKGISPIIPLNAEPQFWYNKDLDTTQFFIPGLISLLLIIISVILTSISLVREKELGTIEQIKVSPVTTLQLIFGKILPYLLISLLIAAMILIMGHLLFGIEVKGSYVFLFVGTLAYLMATLSMGVLISTIADSQQVAFQISQLASQLPTVILSGFIFPIESMPLPVQILSYITPSKYFITILRDILIKGVGFDVFKMQILYLLIFSSVLITIAVIRIKRSDVK